MIDDCFENDFVDIAKGYDFSAPEDLLIEVIKISDSSDNTWANHQVESYLVSTSPDGILGLVSFQANQGDIERFIEFLIDCPGEGVFVIENIVQHDVDWFYSEIREATAQERQLVP